MSGSKVIDSPYFTLMCEFETSSNFADYLDYISRESVKEGVEVLNEKTPSKNTDYEFENSKVSISQEQFLNYLDYMDRKKALESKTKLSKEEMESLQVVMKENEKMIEMLKRMKESSLKTSPKEELQTGMFNLYNDDMSEDEVKEYKLKFKEAQKNNSIMYKDVISFKTEALIVAGIYNPYTDELNRKPLIDASRKMLKQMYKDEGLEQTGVSVGEIHYNTNNFHIHFATVETVNTRKPIVNPETGLIEPKGVRKESTLKNMKSAFANYVFDRSEELAKISHLRDTLRGEVKEELRSTDNDKAIQYFSELKSNLPENKKKWNSKNLSKENQVTMRNLVDELMKNNPEFNRYKQLAEEENDFKNQTYGKLPKGQTSFYEGRMEGENGIYYRLSNSILEELKNDSSKVEYNKNVLKEAFRKNPNLLKNEQNFEFQPYGNKQTYGKASNMQSESDQKTSSEQFQKKNESKVIGSNRSVIKQLNRLEKVTNNEFEKYKAELENQKIDRAIQRAQYEQSFE